MIGLAADGRLFGLDVQLLFDIGVSIFNIILLVFLIGVSIILIIFVIKYFKQKNKRRISPSLKFLEIKNKVPIGQHLSRIIEDFLKERTGNLN